MEILFFPSGIFDMLDEYKQWKLEHGKKMEAYALAGFVDRNENLNENNKNPSDFLDEHTPKKLKSNDDLNGIGKSEDDRLVCLPVKYLR
jgi:hypothetical protein